MSLMYNASLMPKLKVSKLGDLFFPKIKKSHFGIPKMGN